MGGVHGGKMNLINKKKVNINIRPEDITALILKNLPEWNTREKIKENILKIHNHLKNERIDKLQSDFGINNKL